MALAWTSLLAYFPIVLATAPACDSICSGLSCNNYSLATCAFVFAKSGCVCSQGCQCDYVAPRRMLASESCPATCSFMGTTCDDVSFLEIGLTCSDLESVDFFRTPCVCDDCACASTAIPERPRSCSALSTLSALDTRHAIASALAAITQGQCGKLHLASKLVIGVHEQLTVSAATNISIDGASSQLLATHSNRLILVSPAASLEISHMTLEGGYSNFLGGCVAVGFDGSLIATNVILNRCASLQYGGGIGAFTQATLFLYNSSILNCVAADRGGGMFTWRNTKIMLADTSIVNSSAVDGGGIFGGLGVAIELRGSARLSNCISENSGGGIYTYDWYGDITLTENSKIERCVSTYGGGVHTDFYGSVTMTDNASMADCVASDTGGGLFIFWGGVLSVSGSAGTWRNRALFGAGFVLWSEAMGELTDRALVESNFASFTGGGGVVYEDAYLLVGADASIVGNGAAHEGGGLGLLAATATVKGKMTSNFAALRDGGAILGYGGSSVSIIGGSISDSVAQGSGGGLYLDRSPTLTVINASVSRNVAISGDGGGICVFGDDSITRFVGHSEISKNRAMMFGGGVRADGSLILHAGVHVSGNFAGDAGGGLAAFGRVFTSSARAKWVEVEMDFISEGLEAAESWSGVLDVETRFPYDARGQSTLLTAVESLQTAVLCLQTGRQYSFEGYSSLSTGWSGGTATYVQIMDDGAPRASVSVTLGSHAESRQFWNHADVADPSAENAAVFVNSNFATRGAGIFLGEEASLFAYGTNISGNRATQGGGMYVSTLAEAHVFNCTLSLNVAFTSGGGAFVATLSTVQMHECRVTSNTATQGAGAIVDTARTVQFDRVSFEKNFADEGGAVAILKTSPASFLDTTFRSNTATDRGAALFISDSDIGIGRCRFSRNVAEEGDGGAVASYGQSEVHFFPTNSSLEAALVACPRTQVDVITDMSVTTATCSPVEFSGTGNTCDYWPRAVFENLLLVRLSKTDPEVYKFVAISLTLYS